MAEPLENIENLLPAEAKQLREYFKREQLVEAHRKGEVLYEVEAEKVEVLTHNPKIPGLSGIVLVMEAQGVSLWVPVNRQILKRLKHEFEAEENWRKRAKGGERRHAAESYAKRNTIPIYTGW